MRKKAVFLMNMGILVKRWDQTAAHQTGDVNKNLFQISWRAFIYYHFCWNLLRFYPK